MTTPAPASPLPWTVKDWQHGFIIAAANGIDVGDSLDNAWVNGADALYAVHCANTLPKVEAERDRLRAVILNDAVDAFTRIATCDKPTTCNPCKTVAKIALERLNAALAPFREAKP